MHSDSPTLTKRLAAIAAVLQAIGVAFLLYAYAPGNGDVGYLDQIVRHVIGTVVTIVSFVIAVVAIWRRPRRPPVIATFFITAVVLIYALGLVFYFAPDVLIL